MMRIERATTLCQIQSNCATMDTPKVIYIMGCIIIASFLIHIVFCCIFIKDIIYFDSVYIFVVKDNSSFNIILHVLLLLHLSFLIMVFITISIIGELVIFD